jgi:N-acyl-D-amino-acid deacylase
MQRIFADLRYFPHLPSQLLVLIIVYHYTFVRTRRSSTRGSFTNFHSVRVMKLISNWDFRSHTAAAFFVLLGLVSSTQAQNQTVDILLKGGTVYDGSEGKPFVGDVAIIGDRIVYVGPKANVTAKRTIDATGMVVAPGFIDGHAHSQVYLEDPDPKVRQVIPQITQGVTTIVLGVDGGGTTELKDLFARYKQQGIGVNVVSYVGFGTIRKRVIGEDARAPTAPELATEKDLVVKGMCEGALGFSTGLFYAPQSFAKTDEVIELAKEAAKRGGIYDTHQRDESSYSIGLINSTKEVLQIGREANIPVHFSHIKALGPDVWGKSADVIKLIDDARAAGQNVTANQYPWLASSTGLDAALVPRWVEDGGYPAMIKRFNDPALTTKIHAEMMENMRRRGGPHSILLLTPGLPWTDKYLDEMAKIWRVDPIDAAIRILHQTEHESIISFNMSQRDVDTFMKQPWVSTSTDGGGGHPRTYSTYPLKYQDYVVKRKVITLPFFIRHSSGLSADQYGLDHRGYLRSGYFADVLVFDPVKYAPKADFIHRNLPATGVGYLMVNGALAIDNGKMTDVLSGRALPHTPPPGTCS